MALFGQEPPPPLFIQVLDWMLVPLVLVWPGALIGTYLVGMSMMNESYDRELLAAAQEVVEEMQSPSGVVARGVFLVDISTPAGDAVGGHSDLPNPVHDEPPRRGAFELRDAFVDGEPLRVAYGLFAKPGSAERVLVQVGDPLARRNKVVSRMTSIVMGVILLLVPLTVALVWFGLRMGLRPLFKLQRRIEGRAADDLSPIPPEDVPGEISPLMDTLNAQLARVRRNLEAQRRFVADAAHQMRTPLAGLKTQAEAALRGDTLADAHARLTRIEESADRMSRLVTQLLALARADDARACATPEAPVDLNAVARDVCSSWADRALERRVGLHFDPAPETACVRGDAILLAELLANLVDNAVAYTPEGGEISVAIQADPPAMVVDDTGCGIPEGERAMVFERFHRVLGTDRRGSGLGLSIVRAIAELHGAAVRILDGSRGSGTRVVVEFAR